MWLAAATIALFIAGGTYITIWRNNNPAQPIHEFNYKPEKLYNSRDSIQWKDSTQQDSIKIILVP